LLPFLQTIIPADIGSAPESGTRADEGSPSSITIGLPPLLLLKLALQVSALPLKMMRAPPEGGISLCHDDGPHHCLLLPLLYTFTLPSADIGSAPESGTRADEGSPSSINSTDMVTEGSWTPQQGSGHEVRSSTGGASSSLVSVVWLFGRPLFGFVWPFSDLL
jgi:hypothetical protein